MREIERERERRVERESKCVSKRIERKKGLVLHQYIYPNVNYHQDTLSQHMSA